jgi:aminoglycoside phosphotransferase family enzyme
MRAAPRRAGRAVDRGAEILYVDEHARPLRRCQRVRTGANEQLASRNAAVAHRRLMPFWPNAARAAFIRRIHGDLHLGNIALIDGQPGAVRRHRVQRLIASGDLLYDLAFLLMDLCERGLALQPTWCSTVI